VSNLDERIALLQNQQALYDKGENWTAETTAATLS